MSWFWAAMFVGYAALIVIEREPAPWWWCAVVCLHIAGGEVRKELKKRRG